MIPHTHSQPATYPVAGFCVYICTFQNFTVYLCCYSKARFATYRTAITNYSGNG